VKGEFRVFNRWDEKKISETDKYGCVAPNGSIQSREVLGNIPLAYDDWRRFSLSMNVSPYKDGTLEASIGEKSSGELPGGNVYNDKRPPFIKFGIYKPAGWSESELQSGKEICASYKNFHMQSSPVTH
jgi:hypothetical protein